MKCKYEVDWNTADVSMTDLPVFLSDHDGNVKYSHLSAKDRKRELTKVHEMCCKAEGKEFKAAPVKPETPEDNGGV